MSDGCIGYVDITIYDKDKATDGWAQATYCVHGHDDVLWTDDIEQAVAYLREDAPLMLEKSKKGKW